MFSTVIASTMKKFAGGRDIEKQRGYNSLVGWLIAELIDSYSKSDKIVGAFNKRVVEHQSNRTE